MRRGLAITVLIVAALYGEATSQMLTPRFEMQLFVEDAMGNRDTLEIGYDERASFDSLSLEFGEVPVFEPFDSVLDIRAIHIDAFYDTTFASRRIIGYAEFSESNGCYVSNSDIIFIHAKYLPVAITYDRTLLNSTDCHNNTILSKTWEVGLLENWWEASPFDCMANQNTIIEDFSEFSKDPNCCISKKFDVLGQGLTEIPAYWINWRMGAYCQTVSSEVREPASIVKVYPNPTVGPTFIDGIQSAKNVEVFNSNGILVLNIKGVIDNMVELPANLSSGVYFLRISNQQSAALVRIVKL